MATSAAATPSPVMSQEERQRVDSLNEDTMTMGTESNAVSQSPSSKLWFDFGLRVVSYTKGVEQAQVECFFWMRGYDIEDFHMEFADTGGVTILNAPYYAQHLKLGDTVRYVLDVLIPDNDTTFLCFDIDASPFHFPGTNWFVTTGQELLHTGRDPALGPVFPKERPLIPLPDPLPRTPAPRPVMSQEERQRIDSLNEARWAEERAQYRAYVDSVRCDSIPIFEQTPLTDAEYQYVNCNGEYLGRKRGEYKFRPAGDVSGANADRDSQLQFYFSFAPDTAYIEIIATIRKPEQLEYLKTVECELRSTDRPDLYRCRVTRDNLHQFVGQKLEWQYASEYDRRKQREREGDTLQWKGTVPSTSDTEDDETPPRIRSPMGISETGQSIIFCEDFEGDWEYDWEMEDVWDEDSGPDFWGPSTATASSGSRSVWCNGYGNMPDPGPYDNLSLAKMFSNSGISTVGYENLHLTFQLWNEMPPGPNFDHFSAAASPDGTTWPGQYYWVTYGSYPGWHNVSYDLELQDRVYLRFVFQSGINQYGYRGVYIDDVAIEGDPLANLRAYTPSGWQRPLCLNRNRNDFTSGLLYGGEPAYMSFAFTNTGPADAGPFRAGVFLDGAEILGHDYTGLAVGDTVVIRNVGFVAPGSGNHEFKLHVDCRGSGQPYEVREWWEHDNYDTLTTYVEVPVLTIEGTVLYTDPNLTPPDTTRPARGITVVAWDEDGVTDDSMGYAITDDLGRFTIGPVLNYDETDMRDVYIEMVAQNQAAHVHVGFGSPPTSPASGTLGNVSSPSVSFPPVIIDTVWSAEFFIADKLKDGRDQWMVWRPGETPPATKVVLCDTITGWDRLNRVMWVGTDTLGTLPDIFDGDIMLHEYAHFLCDTFNFFDGGGGSHSWVDSTGAPIAASEGFATFFSCAVRNDSLSWDGFSHNKIAYRYFANVESGRQGLDGIYDTIIRNDAGVYYEAANAGVLWDIFDPTDDDFNGDLVGDTISLGIDPILQTLLDGNYHGSHPDSLMDFWYVWMNDQQLNHEWGMYSVFGEHGITMPCCMGNVGSVHLVPNCDPSTQMVTVSDLTDLIDHLFINFTPLCCREESDVSPLISGGVPDMSVDVSDMQALIDYLFITFTPLPACPQFTVKNMPSTER